MSDNTFAESNALLMGDPDSARSAFTADDKPGTAVAGILVDLEARHARHHDTGKLLYWAGPGKPPSDKETDRPVMEVVATLQTEEQDHDGDDGRRAVYLTMGVKTAYRDALKAAGVRAAEPGAHLEIVYTGKNGKQKTYAATYTAPKAVA